MGQQKNFGATSWMLIAASWLTVAPPLLAAQQTVKLTEQLRAPVVKPWRNVHTPTRNLVELVLPAPSKPLAHAQLTHSILLAHATPARLRR